MKTPPSDNKQLSLTVLGVLRTLAAGIWVLGFVSMFMDISSKLIHSLLPVFMGTVLGASMTAIGLVEGVADLALAVAVSPLIVFIGAALWGLHMGLTQGVFAMLVADTAPDELRGTAFGIFNLVGGVALLLASVIAGAFWTALGAPATFLAGAALALLGLVAYPRAPQTGQ